MSGVSESGRLSLTVSCVLCTHLRGGSNAAELVCYERTSQTLASLAQSLQAGPAMCKLSSWQLLLSCVPWEKNERELSRSALSWAHLLPYDVVPYDMSPPAPVISVASVGSGW